MIQEEIFLRLLQASTALGTVTLLITCMSMHRVKWWLPLPIYGLMFSCLISFMTTLFMRSFVFEATVITIAMLGIAGTATALHAYIQPIPPNRREAINRRVLYFALPLMGILLTVWCVGVTYEGGVGFLQRFEQKLNQAIDNQDALLSRMDSTNADLNELKGKMSRKSAGDSAYRVGLDKKLQQVNDRLDDQSLRLHRLQTNQQKSFHQNP